MHYSSANTWDFLGLERGKKACACRRLQGGRGCVLSAARDLPSHVPSHERLHVVVGELALAPGVEQVKGSKEGVPARRLHSLLGTWDTPSEPTVAANTQHKVTITQQCSAAGIASQAYTGSGHQHWQPSFGGPGYAPHRHSRSWQDAAGPIMGVGWGGRA